MITDRLKAALREEGSAAFLTEGPRGPHLVATWNSYIHVVDDATLVFPAGGYRETETNVRSGSRVQMIIGGHVPEGVGFRLTGRAELEVDTPHHALIRQRFPWARAAVVLHVSEVEQVLGK
ncbi:FMN-binding pyridoxamine 5'-phosphate oxidase-related protein [Anaeromyxobacter dehalogenans 2CP-C]|uniref:FMN-binding pyridoxamine 5'-phosphate oxidase-related protein n=1 Tax=Anaeromyxobacter dehalogenans (strain 2CP-C) TaxID=290397 RepID=Q2IFD7_ANADE|nr:FMN-binding pyridoxamine 5'-phosphate oxidase-related protein [Anaeromyxobacter dehalogenans 2CP-C]